MKSGLERERIAFTNMDEFLKKEAFEQEGGLQHSDLIFRGLISNYIPFLPLERKHVKMCAKVEALKQGHLLNQEFLDKVADTMSYGPEGTKMFSNSGCRGVDKKVALVVGRYRDEL